MPLRKYVTRSTDKNQEESQETNDEPNNEQEGSRKTTKRKYTRRTTNIRKFFSAKICVNLRTIIFHKFPDPPQAYVTQYSVTFRNVSQFYDA